jgi:hypothetical protein
MRWQSSQRMSVNVRWRSWIAYEKAKAKERYDQNVGRPKVGEEKSKETFPSIQSRDAIGARVGVSGRTQPRTVRRLGWRKKHQKEKLATF